MARTYTDQQLLDSLYDALANNRLSISIGGRSITYQSMKEIRETIKLLQRRVNSGKSRRNFVRFRGDA